MILPNYLAGWMGQCEPYESKKINLSSAKAVAAKGTGFQTHSST